MVLPSGERLPLLINRDSGTPLHDPNAFIMQNVRGRGCAASTISQALRAIAILQMFLRDRAIDLEERLRKGNFLTVGELEGLKSACQRPVDYDDFEYPTNSGRRTKTTLRFRHPKLVETETVQPDTTGIRLLYIEKYLDWFGKRYLQLLPFDNPLRVALHESIPETIEGIRARRPIGRHRHSARLREGLDNDTVKLILRIVDVGNPENPWRSRHVRIRNYLIIVWLFVLGIRRGELCGIRMSHLNTPMTHVQIVRRADDPNDPRENQPNAKTAWRAFLLPDPLARLTRDYVLNVRRHVKGATKHDFLFIANGTGAPVSLSTVNEIFETLRSRFLDLPRNLSPHICRHTLNDFLTEIFEDPNFDARIPDITKNEIRSYWNGWSPTGKSASNYTKHSTRLKAEALIIELQKKIEGQDD